MFLNAYEEIKIFRAKCNASFTSLFCEARTQSDISEVLPYLNARLGGHEYLTDPPALIFKVHGRLITLHPDKISMNALKDKDEARKILDWLQREINEAHERRGEITPSYASAPKPSYVKLLGLLPRTNCGECGAPTCLVFASRLTEGICDPEDCPRLAEDEFEAARNRLKAYLDEIRVKADWI